MANKFVHLHTHSHYSLLDGLGKPDQLLDFAKEQGMDTLALTDHGAMYGAIEFYEEAKSRDMKPIIGVETYIAPRGMTDKTAQLDSKAFHLVLLAKNFEGYQNLLKLVSEAHLHGYYYKPRIDKELLRKHSKGLIALSACLGGEIPNQLLNGTAEKAVEIAKEYQSIFGQGNFFLELQHHPDIPSQTIANEGVIELAKKLDIPLVATNDIHYVKSEDRAPHELLVCVQTGKTVQDADHMTYDGDFSMRSPADMAKAFEDVPEAIENTVKIAEMCNVDIPLGKEILPIFPLPKGKSDNEYLKELCLANLEKRYPGRVNKEIKDRLEYELSVIANMGFAGYFLIVQDYVNYAKNHEILVGPGRGSAAGSIVTYLLNITDLDPLEHGLLFERFLNPDRIEMPDIDIDFADTQRHLVLDYIRKKYSDEHVAGIITFGTMAARAAVRDTGRALGMAYGDVDRIAKLVPPPVQGRHIPLEKSVVDNAELKAVYDAEPATKQLLDMAMKLEGTVRHASQHACAIVISRDELTSYTPLQTAQKGDVAHVTQYSMKPVGHLGLLKMDFLGLSNLSIIGRALSIVEAVWGQKIDIHKLPIDDKATYELLGRGETTGVFQLESSGMKRYIKELKPTKLDDITAMVSLYRPGPLQFIESFINRKHGREKVSYPHPLVQNALEPTYGIPVYQEQVMQIAKDMAKFTGGEADTLRKAMGKKIAKLMAEMKVKFINGSVNNGVEKETATAIFKMLEDFAAYGFNKSHAACYALIAYQTAYLKTHYPAAFMAAIMTSDLQDNDRIGIEIEEANSIGLKVLPPDVNESFVDFGVVVEKGTPVPINNESQSPKIIRFGLAGIKNVGVGVAEAIVKERKAQGPYQNIANFISRLSGVGSQAGSAVINKKSIEALAQSGALDCLVERNTCLHNMEKILQFAGHKSRLPSSQVALFDTLGVQMPEESLKLEEIAPATDKQKLAWEKELLGIYLSEHPLQQIANSIKGKTTEVAKLSLDDDNKEVRVIGVIGRIKKITTKAGQAMAFATIEDLSGQIELILFPRVLEESAELWQSDVIVDVRGKVSTKDNALKILVNKARLIDPDNLTETIETEEDDFNLPAPRKEDKSKEAKPSKKKSVAEYTIALPRGTKKDLLLKFKDVLEKFPGDSTVILLIPQNSHIEKVMTRTKVTPSKELDQAIENILRPKN